MTKISPDIGCQILLHFAHNGIGANDVLTVGQGRQEAVGVAVGGVAHIPRSLLDPLFISFPPTEEGGKDRHLQLQGIPAESRDNFVKCSSTLISKIGIG